MTFNELLYQPLSSSFPPFCCCSLHPSSSPTLDALSSPSCCTNHEIAVPQSTLTVDPILLQQHYQQQEEEEQHYHHQQHYQQQDEQQQQQGAQQPRQRPRQQQHGQKKVVIDKKLSLRAQLDYRVYLYKNWHCPRPSRDQKGQWVKKHPGLVLGQVHNWWINTRRRLVVKINAKLNANPALKLKDFKQEIICPK